jgi:hypothetical protein
MLTSYEAPQRFAVEFVTAAVSSTLKPIDQLISVTHRSFNCIKDMFYADDIDVLLDNYNNTNALSGVCLVMEFDS